MSATNYNSAEEAEQDALELASRAVYFDKESNWDAAIYYYLEAAKALESATQLGTLFPLVDEKIKEYKSRVDILTATKNSQNVFKPSSNLPQEEMERAEFLLYQALDEDEAGSVEEAVELYSQAVELCLQARKQTNDLDLQSKLAKLATQALERAENLKGLKSKNTTEESEPSTNALAPKLPLSSLQSPTSSSRLGHFTNRVHLTPDRSIGSSPVEEKQNLCIAGSGSYSKEEIAVLRLTSLINGREYVPFMSVDLKERFAYPIPFCDKDGKPALAPKQKNLFAKWARPHEICSNPKMIELIDYFSIKQTVVSDCSFVSSVAISALYEKKFKKKLITSIIHPQNRNGEPVYNPCGKYMVKLHINGVRRKVIIDDFLPLGTSNELLCSYSTNRNELWISLLEKAYMKVMGGYDFPGSNSNIDLHALTGWIPERVAIRPNDKDFDMNQVFKKILDRFHKGDVLVTVSTGELSEIEAERAGLVPTHAYAMLDVREVKGKQLFLLKNPWSHLRWKGNFSERDSVNWTKEMREALNFDPKSAQMFDNGVFWIDYQSLCKFFDVIYMNWNPSLFKFTYCIHQTWKAGLGPIKDVYNVGENPQYSLEVKAPTASAVWILLTRHITDREDFAQNREYITVLVYKNDGKRVYYPYDPPAYIDGTRINSPHYLCKLMVNSAGVSRYTLVISQYEKMHTIHYTLRVYSTCPFSLAKIGNPYKHKQEITNAMWKGITAGGCANHSDTYKNNPIFQIQMMSSNPENQLLIDLKGPKQYQVGFDVVAVSLNNPNEKPYCRKSSGLFRAGFAILELTDVPAGIFNIIPSTFLPGQEAPFFLTVQTSCPMKILRIQ